MAPVPLLLNDQLTAESFSCAPLPSRAAAVKRTTSPVRASADAGLTVNLCTASRTTCSVTELLAPSDVALIVTLPGAIAMIRPAASTLAIDGFSEVHLITASLRGLPSAERATTVIFSAPPTTRAYSGFAISRLAIFGLPTFTVALFDDTAIT